MLKKCEIRHKNRKTASFWNLSLLLLLFWRDEIPPGCVWYALRVNRHIFSDTFSFFREFSFELNIKKDPVYNWLLDADSKFMMGQQGDLRHGMRSEERSFLLYLLINRKFMFHCARCKKSLKRVQHRPGGIEIKFFNCPMVNLWSFMFKNDEPILLSPFDVYVECQIWCICRPYLNPGELGLSDIIQSGNQCLKRSLEIRLRDLFFMIAFLFKRSFVTCAGMTKGVRRNVRGTSGLLFNLKFFACHFLTSKYSRVSCVWCKMGERFEGDNVPQNRIVSLIRVSSWRKLI